MSGWVKSGGLALDLPLPVCPDQRTSSDQAASSGSCQEHTAAFGLKLYLFD
jgi:hypothetical protein